MNKLILWLSTVAVALGFSSSFSVHAALRVPYQPDGSTLHLWHFDEPVGTSKISDAVARDGIVLTVTGLPDGAATNAVLGAPSFELSGHAFKISDQHAFAKGASFSNALSFADQVTGAFTFEAILRFDVNPLTVSNNMEIVCGDGDNTLTNRGWQFRINKAGEMEFNLLAGSASDNDCKAALPASGPDAAAAGRWYHIAVTFTGTKPTNGDPPNILTFYWTALEKTKVSASLLGQFLLSRPLTGDPAGQARPTLGVGGSARLINGPANGEGLVGIIDEVRISNVARKAGEMAFGP